MGGGAGNHRRRHRPISRHPSRCQDCLPKPLHFGQKGKQRDTYLCFSSILPLRQSPHTQSQACTPAASLPATMAPPYLNTPRTDVNETILSPDKRIGFDSEIASFIAPPNADQIHPSNGQAFASRTLMTPVARAPLARRRHLNAKPEFTPLLKSAAKNRMFRDNDSKENPDVSTPGGSRLRMSVGASSPAFPDHSVMVDSSVTGMDHTPVIHESSSSMSTPIPMMPRKGELGLGNADGNILSLKEQEAVSLPSLTRVSTNPDSETGKD